jgi:hypothetical protein
MKLKNKLSETGFTILDNMLTDTTDNQETVIMDDKKTWIRKVRTASDTSLQKYCLDCSSRSDCVAKLRQTYGINCNLIEDKSFKGSKQIGLKCQDCPFSVYYSMKRDSSAWNMSSKSNLEHGILIDGLSAPCPGSLNKATSRFVRNNCILAALISEMYL